MSIRKKVILDTDIGNDIDDIWALGLLLTLEEIDILMISTCFQETDYRAKIVAKMLQILGRTDIPVAIGYNNGKKSEPSQQRWVEDFNFEQYPGQIYYDGIQAVIDTIRSSDCEVTLLCIGAATNLAMILESYPEVVQKSKIIGMYGSIYKGYIGLAGPCSEANVYVDQPSFNKIMKSDWPITLVPLDACRSFLLDGNNYAQLKAADNKLTKLIMENYSIWQEDYHGGAIKYDIQVSTSILFDVPPVLYLHKPSWFKTEEICLSVTPDSMTVPSSEGKKVNALVAIQEDGELEAFVTRQLTTYAEAAHKGAGGESHA